MLTNRDRRRFERVTARAKRPSGRASVAAMLGRLSTSSLLVGLTVVAVAVGLGGFYASRSALEPRNADLALGGRPTAAPEPVQETPPARLAEPRRAEVAWALLEKCLARGPGMTLTTQPGGYQYTVRGRTQRYSGGAAVAEDEGAAFAAFTSFTPEPDVVAHCDSMKKRAAG